ncbi:hypothetical protein EOB59_27090 [Mesorhizobium sp. M7A.F.Ca.MR.176.00.0.0]|uniref:hypothetical protein n=1 Tax=unclassified Mesorhizobium TaxID=325217 RepID=UPI000FD60C4A|nr:hypothetical protein [Mesorhizobium sp. M7A.F.Ca.MR.176.00.0.0]RUU87018.1 hypothetical protein EOB59_27090 [Mesorhizobium sp. M7A.F.Ca.MR.176.00.0.0]
MDAAANDGKFMPTVTVQCGEAFGKIFAEPEIPGDSGLRRNSTHALVGGNTPRGEPHCGIRVCGISPATKEQLTHI